MTFDNDICVWRWHYCERHSCVSVSVNAQATRAMHPVFTHYHIVQWSSRLDWSKFVYRDEYRNDKKCCFLRVFVKKIHIKHKIVEVAVINDNNNFAPSLFRSLCEFFGDCFGPRYFSSGAALPQKNTSVQNNHLRFHTMTSKKMVRSYYCLNTDRIGCMACGRRHKLNLIFHLYCLLPFLGKGLETFSVVRGCW